MIQHQSKSQPKWTDVKAKLASFDRAGLLALVQDLYAAHPDNRSFFTLVLAWVRMSWNRTSRPLTGGFGRTLFGNKIRRSPKPNKPFPITRRPSETPPA